MSVSRSEATQAFKTLQEFTTRPLKDVIVQEGRVATIDPVVLRRIKVAASARTTDGATVIGALHYVRLLAAEGASISELLDRYADVIGFSRSAIVIRGLD